MTAPAAALDLCLYVRISADPKGQGLGVQRQEKEARAYIRRRWKGQKPRIHLYIDNDVSATKGTPRPKYEAMIADIEAGRRHGIVVWAYDRLCRRMADLETVLNLAEKHTLVIGCVAGDIDISTPMGRTLARVISAIAAGEVETMKWRIQAKQRELAEAGKVGNGGRRPYGYTSNRMTVIEEEAVIVREIAARMLAGESQGKIAEDLNRRGILPACADQWWTSTVRAVYNSEGSELEGAAGVRAVALANEISDRVNAGESFAAISKDLNARAIRSIVPTRWSATTVRSVATKPHVAGLRVYRGEIVGEGVWESILDRGTWEAVKSVADGRDRAPGANSRRHLLSGIVHCGLCGAPFGIAYGRNNKGEDCIPRYRCTGCGKTSRNMQHLEQDVIGQTLGRLNNPRNPKPAREDAVTPAATELAALKRRRRQTLDGFADLGMDEHDLRRVLMRIDTRVAELEQKQDLDRARHVLHGLDGITKDEFARLPLDRRRAVVASLLKVTVFPVVQRGRGYDASTVKIEPR